MKPLEKNGFPIKDFGNDISKKGLFTKSSRIRVMRTITALRADDDWTLDVSFDDGAKRRLDL
jgi:hypothetical protein